MKSVLPLQVNGALYGVAMRHIVELIRVADHPTDGTGPALRLRYRGAASPLRSLSTALDTAFTGELLSHAGLEAEIAAGGQATLALIERTAPSLVLSGIGMPSMNRSTLLRNIRARARRLSVIMLTARSSGEYQRRAVAEGADACLLKSGFQVASLLDTLSRFLPASS